MLVFVIICNRICLMHCVVHEMTSCRLWMVLYGLMSDLVHKSPSCRLIHGIPRKKGSCRMILFALYVLYAKMLPCDSRLVLYRRELLAS